MNSHPCCQAGCKPTRSQLGARLCQWFVPSILLALMPKCPMCFAGYIALLTGVGVSFSVAKILRLSLMTACLIALGLLCVPLVRRLWLTLRGPAVTQR